MRQFILGKMVTHWTQEVTHWTQEITQYHSFLESSPIQFQRICSAPEQDY